MYYLTRIGVQAGEVALKSKLRNSSSLLNSIAKLQSFSSPKMSLQIFSVSNLTLKSITMQH
jgi:hypothetical protein